MGISTSGSLLIIFFGAFIALGAVYTATSNTTGELSDAYSEQLSTEGEIQDTAVEVTAVYHESDGNLTIRVDNVGSTALSVAATDVLIDGEYHPTSGFEIATVDGHETDVLGLEQQLRLETESTQPARVKVVTETGVTRSTTVDVASVEQDGQAESVQQVEDGLNEAAQFDITSTYDQNVTLLDVRIVDAVNETGVEPDLIHYEETDSFDEVVIEGPTETVSATDPDGFAIGETVTTAAVPLPSDTDATYTVGEFRTDDDGDTSVVTMVNGELTVEITYEDPDGVERTLWFEAELDTSTSESLTVSEVSD